MGTLPLFGRRLRGHFAASTVGLDDEMSALLSTLFDYPGVAERAVQHHQRDIAGR